MNATELRELLHADLVRLVVPDNETTDSTVNWMKLFSPRFIPVLFVRLSRYFYLSGPLSVLSPVFTWLNVILFGIEFTARCEVGPGLMLPHTSGTVVGALRIGANATIFQGVTFGAKFADLGFIPESRPVVGNDVTVGAGAKVLGGITVGDGAVIAANSLVIEDVEPGAIMIGVPAVARGSNQ